MTVLQARSVTRRFGATLALDAVDFDVHAGAVNVLIGENGAGKSTLMRIFAGVDRPSEGQLLLDGRPIVLASVRDAARHGIGIVHQELSLCPNLTVTENIFLARNLGRAALIDRVAEERRAARLLARLGSDIDPAARVSSLRIGQQQIVEIARALATEVRVLILDEPTSALSAAEVDTLFDVIAGLKRDGVAIIYISHRLEELMRIGDHITVLRDGRRVASAAVADVSVPWIVEQMLGGAQVLERKTTGATGRPVLTLDAVTVRRADGLPMVDAVSTAFRAGEVTAVYGLLGSGRTELFEAICGARRHEGHVGLAGEDISARTLAERVDRGLLLVPEDRQRHGLFQNLSVGSNLSLSYLGRLLRLGYLAPEREASEIAAMVSRLGVKTDSAQSPILSLSGGNQQKVVIGRCLMPGPAAILLDEPSRGVDIGARAEVFRAMQLLCEEGICVLFATSDLNEALTVADRILVMSGGRVTADMTAADANEQALVRAANQAQAIMATAQ